VGNTDQDTDAIERLYDEYGAALVLFASAIAVDRARAQDAVHQVFLKLIENGNVAQALDKRAFLFACVRNAVLNDAKVRRRDAPVEVESVWFDPPERDYAEEKNLRLALNSLPDDQREVVVLHLWGELTFSEIAELVGTSANTAASRYRYALTKLRRSMFHKEGFRAQFG
jgi:RNA polymerase sigma-70 factor (ECF subfamily)